MIDFRWVLVVEYHGHGFYGWQYQPHLRTVQGVLHRALCQFFGINADQEFFQPLHLIAAGRTDRGVHARAQWVHLELPPSLHEKLIHRPAHAWQKGINTFLPDDLRVLALHRAPADFSARKSAIARHYRYFLLSHAQPSAHFAHQIGWTWRRLNGKAMQIACQALIGTHDFSTFRDSECQAQTPIRTLHDCRVECLQHNFWQAGSELFVFHFQADAFLHHMIRNLVGSLIEIGAGRQSPEWMNIILEKRDRTAGGMTFMPDGLYLWQVDYANEWLDDPPHHAL